MAKAFAKFGKNLKDPETEIEFYEPKNFKVKNIFNRSAIKPMNMEEIDKIFNSS